MSSAANASPSTATEAKVAPKHEQQQKPTQGELPEDNDDDGNDEEGGQKLSKAAKRRLKEKQKKQEALALALSKLEGDNVSLGSASKEQLAAAQAAVQAQSAEHKAEAVGATLAVELPLGEIRPEPTDGNIFPVVRKGFRRQTFPEPTVPVCKQFAADAFPAGQILEHHGDFNTHRITSEELRALERATYEPMLYDLRQAAEVHRQVRRWAQSWIAPGLPLITITDRIEAKLEELIVKNGIKAGQAFPTGCSVNFIAAHFTPNTGDKQQLKADDVLKIDFGTQINGRIIDSAWTWHQNPQFDPLVAAVKAATNEGVRNAGIDVRLGDIGAAIQEVMESYEVEIDKKVYQVKPIRNLCGHNISPYTIHGGKSVPIVKSNDDTKMEEGELFAIETFGSTGRGVVYEDLECSHYGLTKQAATAPLRSDKAKGLLSHIQEHFGTLPFCRKWLDRQGQDRHLMALNQLCDAGAVDRYPPLVDIKSSYTAQSEHTFILRPTCKEVLSRGADY
jgi:methionyl aminopeptidase